MLPLLSHIYVYRRYFYIIHELLCHSPGDWKDNILDTGISFECQRDEWEINLKNAGPS